MSINSYFCPIFCFRQPQENKISSYSPDTIKNTAPPHKEKKHKHPPLFDENFYFPPRNCRQIGEILARLSSAGPGRPGVLPYPLKPETVWGRKGIYCGNPIPFYTYLLGRTRRAKMKMIDFLTRILDEAHSRM